MPQAVGLPADLQRLSLRLAGGQEPCSSGIPASGFSSVRPSLNVSRERIPHAGHKRQGRAWRRALCWVVVFILKHWTSVVALQVLTKELCAVWSEPPESPYTRWGTWLTRPVRALSPECRAVCFPGAGALDRLRGAAARAVPREEGPATGSWARPAGTRKGKSHGVCEPKSANSEGPSLFHRGDIQTPSASQQEMLWQRDRASGVKARVKSEAPEGRAGFEMMGTPQGERVSSQGGGVRPRGERVSS